MRACQRDDRRRSITPARHKMKSVLNEQASGGLTAAELGDRNLRLRRESAYRKGHAKRGSGMESSD